jgi:hypothetical protein
MVENIPPPLIRMKRENSYPPVGGCIYCSNAATSKEHIIPRSLGGMLLLPDASCSACAGITHAFEGQCADKLFSPIRRQFGLPSRSGKRRNKDPKSAVLDGVSTIIPDGDFPGIIIGFAFDLPGILGLGPPAKAEFTGKVSIGMLPEFGNRMNRLGANEIKFVSTGITTLMFGRMLAKIAHAYAIAEMGRSFKPLLLEIIKNPDEKFIGHLVGGGFGPLGAGDDLHEISIDPFFQRYVVVQIRLFADRSLPTYWVVAGDRG